MLAKDAEIIRRIRAAHLPPYVLTTTLAKLGHAELRRIIDDRAYRDHATGDLRSYVIRSDRLERAQRAAAVFGKEMLLSKVPLYSANLGSVDQSIRHFAHKDEDQLLSPVLSFLRGQHMVVMVDMDLQSYDPSSKASREALDRLCSHVFDGGGLVVAYGQDCGSALGFDHQFDTLLASFEEVNV